MRLGAFVAPYHCPDGRPGDALERDLDLAETLEDMGYDEIWYGEHHSGGWETIASPELMIAAAAQRTFRIRLGTGVVSLPYHHPFTTAGRIVQLDHMTRGRLMFGVGSGALAEDARMMGLAADERVDAFAAALDAVTALLAGRTVTRRTQRFDLVEARLQLPGFLGVAPPLYIASSFAGAGLREAARRGAGLLLLGVGRETAARFRRALEDAAASGGRIDCRRLLLILNIHVGETRAAAIEAIRDNAWVEQERYWTGVIRMPAPDYPAAEHVERMIERGHLMAGGPGQVIDSLRLLLAEIGPVGGVLVAHREWAGAGETRRSYELLAREVLPALDERAAGTQPPIGLVAA